MRRPGSSRAAAASTEDVEEGDRLGAASAEVEDVDEDAKAPARVPAPSGRRANDYSFTVGASRGGKLARGDSSGSRSAASPDDDKAAAGDEDGGNDEADDDDDGSADDERPGSKRARRRVDNSALGEAARRTANHWRLAPATMRPVATSSLWCAGVKRRSRRWWGPSGSRAAGGVQASALQRRCEPQ